MNIFHKVALQGLKKNRTRTFVTIIGVILSSALITGVATFGISLLNYMINGSVERYGNWHAAFSNVDSSFIKEEAADESLADRTVIENIGYAELEGSKNPDKPYLFLAGFDEKAFQTLPINLISGRLPENRHEVVVSGSVEGNGGVKLKVGDTLSLEVGNRMDGNKVLFQEVPYSYEKEKFVPSGKETYTITGVFQRPAFEEISAPGYTLVTKADEADRADSFSLFVTLKNPYRLSSYTSRIENHAYFLNDKVLQFMGIFGDKLFNGLLYTVGGIVILIIMTGSVFLIYNSFNISLNEQKHQFGIFASVGATERQLRNSVLFEGFCIGGIGIPVGILVGIGCIGLVISVVARNFKNILYTNVPFTVTLSVPAIAGAAAISLVTILISAYIPARKAAGASVMECIRQTNEIKIERKALKTSKLSERIYGLEGTLALKNFKRNKKRYRSIVLSLVLSVVLFVSVNTFVTCLKQASSQAKVVSDYDIGIVFEEIGEDRIQPLLGKLKSADGISAGSYRESAVNTCLVSSGDLSEDYWKAFGKKMEGGKAAGETVSLSMDVQVLDDDAYLGILKKLGLPAAEYTGENAKFVAVGKMEDESGEAESIEECRELFNKSSLDGFNGSSGDITLCFAEFVPPDGMPRTGVRKKKPYFFEVLVPNSLKERFQNEDTEAGIKGFAFCSEDAGRSVKALKTILEDEGIMDGYTLYNLHQMTDESRNYIFIANVFAYTFISMIALIAVANVFNTISTNIKLRRRELAMLRSVGMSERDFQKMMNFECAFFGGRALLFGLPAAVFCSWLIYKGMFAGGADSLRFTFPWASIGISVFGVLFIVFITMLYAISQIKKENIIEALRDDLA